MRGREEIRHYQCVVFDVLTNLAGHLRSHLGLLDFHELGVGDLLVLRALNFRYLEVHLPRHQLALAPRHRLARLVSRPDLKIMTTMTATIV